VVLDHVVVVEQPFPGGADVDALVGGAGEPGMRGLQDPARAVEAIEKGSAPARPLPPVQPLPGSQALGPLGQMLGAQQLATDRPREQVFAGVGTARDEAGDEPGFLELSDGVDPGRMFDAV
jgi:hypothetical protein